MIPIRFKDHHQELWPCPWKGGKLRGIPCRPDLQHLVVLKAAKTNGGGLRGRSKLENIYKLQNVQGVLKKGENTLAIK